MNRDISIVEHILTHAKRIQLKMINISKDQFLNDEDLKDVVCFNFLQIGELVKVLSINFINLHSKVNWSQIAKFRDKIAHGYSSLTYDKVFEYANIDVPVLIEVCEKALNELKSF